MRIPGAAFHCAVIIVIRPSILLLSATPLMLLCRHELEISQLQEASKHQLAQRDAATEQLQSAHQRELGEILSLLLIGVPQKGNCPCARPIVRSFVPKTHITTNP